MDRVDRDVIHYLVITDVVSRWNAVARHRVDIISAVAAASRLAGVSRRLADVTVAPCDVTATPRSRRRPSTTLWL